MTPDATHIADYNTQVGHRADPYRQEGRVRILIDVIPEKQMIGEAMVPKGKHTVDVPASLVEGLRALVWNEANMRAAKARFERDEVKWLEEHGTDSGLLSPNSISRSYQMMFDEPMGTLRSLEVIDDNLPAPMTAEERRAATVAANVVAAGRRPKDK